MGHPVDIVVSEAIPGLSPRFRGYAARPDPAVHPPPWTGVVMLHEAWGHDSAVRRQADDLADYGYLVLAPDMYSGGGSWRRAIPTMRAIGSRRGRAWSDLQGARAWLRETGDCHGPIGIVGFSMGGGMALSAATTGAYGAAAIYYAIQPRDLRYLRGSCPIVASFGGADRLVGRAAPRLERALTEYGVPHDVKEYPGAGHSFMNHASNWPRSLRIFEPPLGFGPDRRAAEDSLRRLDRFFRVHLAHAA